MEEEVDGRCSCIKNSIARIRVGSIALLLILCQSLQVVSFKRIGYSLGPYPYFILLSVSAFFVPIFTSIVVFIRVTGGPFVQEIVRCKYIMHYCVVGILNALNGVLVIFSNPHVGGIMQALLTQTVIPWTLILSCIYLKSRFSWAQYLGAFIATVAIAFAGVFNSMLESPGDNPGPHHNDTSLPNHSDLAGESGESSTLLSKIIWTLIFGLGQVPLAFSAIYQEKTFRKTQVNVFYMLQWASISQFVTLVIALPSNFIPWFGGMDPESLLHSMESAVMCVGMHNSSSFPLQPGCSSASLDLCLCVSFMLLSTLLQTMMVKYSSAALSAMAITLVTPVSAFAFTLSFLLGPHVEEFSWVQWIALALLMVGILTYRQQQIREAICHRANSKYDSKQHPLLDGVRNHSEDGDDELFYGRLRSCSISCAELEGETISPRLLNSRGGIITSEYTADAGQTRILYRGVKDRRHTF